MKHIILTLSFIFSLFISATAQADKITLHNGKTVEGSIVKVSEFTVIFRYLNEDAEQTLSKYLVEKIIYGKSGRVESLSPKIVIASEDDWEKVILLEDNSATAGLTKVGEVKGKTSLINYRTASGNDRKAEEKLKKEAAKLGCQFILITSEKDAGLQSSGSRGLGGTQSAKKGIAYKY